MGYLSREDILNAVDIECEDVAVPEWGGTVRVVGLTGVQRDKFEASVIGPSGGKKLQLSNLRARLVSLAIVDDEGQPVFGTADVAALGNKSAVALERVFSVAQRLSGITESDLAELATDLGNAPTDNSTSD